MAEPPDVVVRSMGVVDWREAYELQKQIHHGVVEGSLPGNLLILQHPHVFTLGLRGGEANLLVGRDELERRGVDLVHADRGGDITYHGPGQLVAYPIVPLRRLGLDVPGYVRGLEEVVIRVLSSLGVGGAGRREAGPGVWVAHRKIASVGVRVRRWVTMHGVALNITTDNRFFRMINPCGLVGQEMTSVEALTGTRPDMVEAERSFVSHFSEVFGCRCIT